MKLLALDLYNSSVTLAVIQQTDACVRDPLVATEMCESP